MISGWYKRYGLLFQVLEDKGLEWTNKYPEPGCTCKTCSHYALEEEVVPDTHEVMPEGEPGLYTKVLTLHGVCLVMMPRFMVANVDASHGCEKHAPKSLEDQFEDDTINDLSEGREV